MAAKEERALKVVPVHRHIIAGLVEKLESEVGHSVVLTFDDDENYDAFKASEGSRKGPWCTIRPNEFEISTSADGQGAATATRPNVFSSGFNNETLMQSMYTDAGEWTKAATAVAVDQGMFHLNKFVQGDSVYVDLLLHKDMDDLPAVGDILVLAHGSRNISLVVRSYAPSGPSNIRYEVDNADGPNKNLSVTRLGDKVQVYLRRAQGIRLLLVPAIIRYTFRYATTDVNEIMDFFAEWAFMRAKNRLDFALRYMGRTLNIKVVMGTTLTLPSKPLPGETGGYQVYEGEIETHGWLTHKDSRDASIEPRVVDVEAVTALGGTDVEAGRKEIFQA